jgi:hypothetical protein
LLAAKEKTTLGIALLFPKKGLIYKISLKK